MSSAIHFVYCCRQTAVAAGLATALLAFSLSVFGTPSVDLAAGEQSYAKCLGCHSPDYNRTGPLHCGLLGRVAGSVKGYEYSSAMRNAAIVWNVKTLNRFLTAPLKMVPGTSMGFAGIADPAERRNLIAWLATLDASAAVCRDVLSNQPEGS